MKHTLFTTRNRADELLKEIVGMWQMSDHKELLEGIEKDPIFSMFIMALAYQSNEFDYEIERLKGNLLEDFAKMLVPDNLISAVPAVALLATNLNDNQTELMIDSDKSFNMKGSDFGFLPLLKTKIIHNNIKYVKRIDGRRWKVALQFRSPIKDLSNISFYIKNPNFQDLEITYKNQKMQLVKPWDYSNLPLSSCFSIESMIYNKTLIYNASHTWFDLFAQQNTRVFYFSDSYLVGKNEDAIDLIELEFEFFGINDDFEFDENSLIFNIVPVINADIHEANLTSSSPIFRVNSNKGGDDKEFLFLIQPNNEQLFNGENIVLRTIDTDRFDISSLIKLSNAIVTKFNSDFYAYQNVLHLQNGSIIKQLRNILEVVKDEVNKQRETAVSGVYIMLKKDGKDLDEKISYHIDYLTTNGTKINKFLNITSQFDTPKGLNPVLTQQIMEPILATKGAESIEVKQALTKYNLMTNDRIVTPADIKAFCYKELFVRYGIIKDMVRKLNVVTQQHISSTHVGYEIMVDISLKDNPFLLKGFKDKISQAEFVMKKMLEVRSVGIYPINVFISINE